MTLDEWQEEQPLSFFHIYQPVLDYVGTIPHQVPITPFFGLSNEIRYSFGDFSIFLITNRQPEEVLVNYFQILLDMYDNMKGMMRRYILGDPVEINHLRTAVIMKNPLILALYNLDDCNYDIRRYHAHTIACNSLHKLIIKLASHALYKAGNISCIHVTDEDLVTSYQQMIFGSPRPPTPILIDSST